MKMTIDGCGVEKVLRVYAETDIEDENLRYYAACGEPMLAIVKIDRGHKGHYLEIRKEADKCQNTHKH